MLFGWMKMLNSQLIHRQTGSQINIGRGYLRHTSACKSCCYHGNSYVCVRVCMCTCLAKASSKWTLWTFLHFWSENKRNCFSSHNFTCCCFSCFAEWKQCVRSKQSHSKSKVCNSYQKKNYLVALPYLISFNAKHKKQNNK